MKTSRFLNSISVKALLPEDSPTNKPSSAFAALKNIFSEKRYHIDHNPLVKLESKEELENNEPDIFSYLLSDKYFRDWVLNGNGEKNAFLEDWFIKYPDSAPEVKKASAYIRGITFEVNQLLPEEMDELLESVYANE